MRVNLMKHVKEQRKQETENQKAKELKIYNEEYNYTKTECTTKKKHLVTHFFFGLVFV